MKKISLWFCAALGLSIGTSSFAQSKLSQAMLDKAGEIASGQCFICHGVEGESSSPIYPRLAGQHAEYIAKQLSRYQSGARADATMRKQVEALTPDDMRALGAYYEKKNSPATEPTNKDLAGMGRYLFTQGNPFSGVPACAACHGATGLGTPQLPRLAGQRANYTENQLKNFNKRVRTDENLVMHSVASKLTELEMHAVAEFISSMR